MRGPPDRAAPGGLDPAGLAVDLGTGGHHVRSRATLALAGPTKHPGLSKSPFCIPGPEVPSGGGARGTGGLPRSGGGSPFVPSPLELVE
eukprot:11723493-Alexandrium_andersonii.AAC.1